MQVDGHEVRLREPTDLSFLARWGRVFAVLDSQDSGNLCLGIEGDDGRVFVKVAGARTLRYDGHPAAAVARARHAAEVYRALAHPSLLRLRDAVEVGPGYALVFDWSDGVPLGLMYQRRHELAGLSLEQRTDAVQQIADFHVHVAERGWVAVDLYDGSVLVDPSSGRVLLCDLDLYRRAPLVNTMGRMWGSTRFMSQEEHRLGATIDEVSLVFTLGALAHSLLGDDTTKDPDAWRGSSEQLDVAARALHPDRDLRWPTVRALAEAWRAASAAR